MSRSLPASEPRRRAVRLGRGVFPALALVLCGAVPAAAHGPPSGYRAEVRAIVPAVPGLTLRVGSTGHLSATNRTGRTVTVLGASGAPFLRLRADGAVERNGGSAVRPAWEVVGRGGRFAWHDARIRRAGAWTVPLRVGDTPVAVRGVVALPPDPEPAPLWPLLAFLGIAAAAGGLSILVNRRHYARERSGGRAGRGRVRAAP